MALPPVDKLMKMSDTELTELLDAELKELYESTTPERRKRLEALQWKIDIKKANAPNKLAATVEIYKLMLDSVYDLNEALHGRKNEKVEGTVHVLKA